MCSSCRVAPPSNLPGTERIEPTEHRVLEPFFFASRTPSDDRRSERHRSAALEIVTQARPLRTASLRHHLRYCSVPELFTLQCGGETEWIHAKRTMLRRIVKIRLVD